MINYNLRAFISVEQKIMDQFLTYREADGTMTYPEYLLYVIKPKSESPTNGINKTT